MLHACFCVTHLFVDKNINSAWKVQVWHWSPLWLFFLMWRYNWGFGNLQQLNGDEWWASCPGCFIPSTEDVDWGRTKIWSCRIWVEKPRGKYVTVLEFNPTFPVIHPLSSFCTNWAAQCRLWTNHAVTLVESSTHTQFFLWPFYCRPSRPFISVKCIVFMEVVSLKEDFSAHYKYDGRFLDFFPYASQMLVQHW